MLVPVKFTKNWRGYNAGEVAGFDPVLAGDLVGSDAAVFLSRDEVQKVQAEEKQGAKDALQAERESRIQESNLFYRNLIEKLDPKKDKNRIDMLQAEREKMAKLLSEQKG
jgi:hypothetical protein